MALFFASDLHGCLPATEKTIRAFESSGADYFLLLGDILNHGPRNPVPEGYNPPEVANLLNLYAQQIIAVRGNCDSEVDQMLLNFPMMMDYAWVLLDSSRRLFLTHGHTYHADNRPPLKPGDVIAHGHTHIPVAEYQGEQIIYNPGSVTFPKGGFPASYGLLDNGWLKVIAFDDDSVLAEVQL